jgi:tripartite motif-containing protein 71
MGENFGRGAVRRRGITFICVVTVFSLSAVGAAPSSATVPAESAPPAPAPQEVASFAKGFVIPAAKAQEEIEIQAEEAQLPQEVSHVLGNHYAGIWFDNARGEFVVPVPNRASARTAEDDVAAQAGNFRTEEVESTWSELEDQQRSLMARLRPMLPAGSIESSLDAESNRIEFDVSAALDAPDLSRLERVVGSSPVATSVDQVAASTLQFGDLSCEAVYRVCSAPMRGGTWWGYPYGGGIGGGEIIESCSVGFPMIGNTYGNRFMLTAGHCLPFSEKEPEVVSTKAAWAEFKANPHRESREIGTLQAYRNAVNSASDWALFNANGGYWDNGTAAPTITAWGIGEEYEILSEGSSYQGQNMCHSGASSGDSCGPVVATDVTGEAEHLGKINRIEHMTEFGPVCAAEGDSGGPVYSGHTAFGVVSAGTEPEKMGCNHYVLYPEITQIAEEAEVHVGPKVGQKPVVRILSTEPATFHAGTVELHGTVDANGIGTNYHFDYGPTNAYGQSSPGGNAGSGFQPVPVSQSLKGLPGSSTFHYRLTAQNTGGIVMTGDDEFTTPAWIPEVKPEEPTSPAAGSETLHGSVNPVGSSTTYQFEYGTTTAYGTKTAVGNAGSGTSPVAVNSTLAGLAAATTYHYRLVATNAEGTSSGTDQSFTTPTYPTINGLEISEVTASTARLNSCVTGNGLQTSYVVEYGTTISYGSKTAPVNTGQGQYCYQNEVLLNLAAGTSYHARIVATNSSGTINGPDVPFTTQKQPSYLSAFAEAGTGTGKSDVAVDPSGNVYVADVIANTIQKFTAAGTYVSAVATSGSGNGQVNGPVAVAADKKGDVWVADDGNHRVEEFSPSGAYLRQISLAPAPAIRGESSYEKGQKPPYSVIGGMDVGPNNEVWVSSRNEGAIYEFSEAGAFIRSSGAGRFSGKELGALAVNPAEGWVYVYAPEKKSVVKFSVAAEEAGLLGAEGTGNGQFRGVSGIAVDSFENVWVSDQGGDRVEEFGRSGRYITQFGGPGSGNGQFSFGPSAGVATSLTGYIYVVDANDHRVERWLDPSHAPSYVGSFGSAGAGAGKFLAPSEVAVDPGGNVYVADATGNTVQKFSASGTYIATSGSGNAQVEGPDAVAADSKGDIWVADAGNKRLEEFGPSGTYLRKIILEPPPPGATGSYVAVAGLDVGPSNEVWISSGKEGRLYEYGETGAFIRSATVPAGGSPSEATQLAVFRDGTVAVTDPANKRIAIFNSAGEYGGNFGPEQPGIQFSGIAGIAVDGREHVWVAERQNGLVNEFTRLGRPLAQFGKPGSGAGQFSFGPAGGIVTSPTGFIYVVDGENKRLEKWSDPRTGFPFP